MDNRLLTTLIQKSSRLLRYFLLYPLIRRFVFGFSKVESGLYRSKTPSKGFLEYLKDHYKIRHVVFLDDSAVIYPPMFFENNQILPLNAQVVDKETFIMMRKERENLLIQIISSANRPILVCCRDGVRTTALIALYQFEIMKMSNVQVVRHARLHGFMPWSSKWVNKIITTFKAVKKGWI